MIRTLRDLLDSHGFNAFSGEQRFDYLNDPDRADRCTTAAADGADGSTHGEHIQDWRDYLDTFRTVEPGEPCGPDELPEDVRDAIAAEIDACEAWHANAGTLNQQIG